MVGWAKKNPSQLLYGHTGVGEVPHLATVKLASKEGFTYKNVTFPEWILQCPVLDDSISLHNMG